MNLSGLWSPQQHEDKSIDSGKISANPYQTYHQEHNLSHLYAQRQWASTRGGYTHFSEVYGDNLQKKKILGIPILKKFTGIK